jgi:hypothetical protein
MRPSPIIPICIADSSQRADRPSELGLILDMAHGRPQGLHLQGCLEGHFRHPPKRLDDGRAHRQVRHEVAIHHVDVDAVGSGLCRLRHLLTQAGEVGGENRGRQLHVAHVLDASKML